MRYKVPVIWCMSGYVEVEAESARDAESQVFIHSSRYEPPIGGTYIEDSLELDMEGNSIPIYDSFKDEMLEI